SPPSNSAARSMPWARSPARPIPRKFSARSSASSALASRCGLEHSNPMTGYRWRFSVFDKLRKHPDLAAVLLTAFAVAIPSFLSTISFIAAIDPEQARGNGQPLPPGWSAGVMSHGSYYRWWTIGERPVLFGLSVFGLTTGMLFIWS